MLDQWNQPRSFHFVHTFAVVVVCFGRKFIPYPRPNWHATGNEARTALEKENSSSSNQPYGDLTHFTEIAKYCSDSRTQMKKKNFFRVWYGIL